MRFHALLILALTVEVLSDDGEDVRTSLVVSIFELIVDHRTSSTTRTPMKKS